MTVMLMPLQKSKFAAESKTESADDSCSDRDSDLDLSNELLPIAGYIGSTDLLVSHMFRSISTKKLKAMLPEILKVHYTCYISQLVNQSNFDNNNMLLAVHSAPSVSSLFHSTI